VSYPTNPPPDTPNRSNGPATTGGPVTTALVELRAFLARAVGDGTAVDTAVPLPDQPQHTPRLCLWPLALLADQGTRGGYGQRQLRARARFAVLADGPVDAAVALLDRVLTATAGASGHQLVLEPVPTTLWGASGVPRPSVLIDVPVRVGVSAPVASRVTGGLVLHGGAVRAITGRVLGPGGVALAGMTVGSPATGTSVVTDNRGGFVLGGQPATGTVALHLSGRGLHLQVEVDAEATDPVAIHCPIEEV
jgi:hypothetical protein